VTVDLLLTAKKSLESEGQDCLLESWHRIECTEDCAAGEGRKDVREGKWVHRISKVAYYAWTSIIKYCRLGSLNRNYLTVLKARNP
jgi:hypothetical protein